MEKPLNQEGQGLSGSFNSHPIIPEISSKKQYFYSVKSNKAKRYPHSDGSVNLSKPCPYCNYPRGLIIIRFKEDKGFCRCGRCDAALYSLNENCSEQGLQHIGTVLDNYLPTSAAFDGEVAK